MGVIWYVVRVTVSFAIELLLLLMFVRAIMSWISPMPQGKVGIFIFNVTEFLVSPVRSLLSRFESIRNFPIDISFTITFFILVLLLNIFR